MTQNHHFVSIKPICFFSVGGARFAVPIELKTDSGPSDDGQFSALSEANTVEGGGYEIFARIALLLGSSSVQDFPTERFRRLRPTAIIDGLESLVGARASGFLCDWIAAVRAECQLYDAAGAVYEMVQEKRAELSDYGFRSDAHLIYYVYAHLRPVLKKEMPGSCWEIYSGNYNAVMNLRSGAGDGWISLRLPRVRALFEFNDDCFVLKFNKPPGTDWDGHAALEELRRWIAEIKNQAKSRSPDEEQGQKFHFPRRNDLNKEWLSVVGVKLDLSDREEVARQVREFVRYFGSDGVLRDYM